MRILALVLLLALPAVAQSGLGLAARPTDPSNDSKDALERLIKGQETLILLTRISIDENRLTRLDGQLQTLLAQERALEKEIAPASTSGRDDGGPQIVLQAGGPPVSMRELAAQQARPEVNRQLNELRQLRHACEAAMKTLRERIVESEQKLEDRLR